MNLRLDDEDSALLKALAESEHVSLHGGGAPGDPPQCARGGAHRPSPRGNCRDDGPVG